MNNAQWREVIKDRVYALCVHDHHRVAIAQVLENKEWLVTMPDEPNARHTAKDQAAAFKVGKKVAVAWLQAALKQLSSKDETSIKRMTEDENRLSIRERQRGHTAMSVSEPIVNRKRPRKISSLKSETSPA